jgi:hypothetical protein
MQVRQVVTGHDAKGRAVLRETSKSMGRPFLAWESASSSGVPMRARNLPERGDSPAAPALFPRRRYPLRHHVVLAGVRRGCTRCHSRYARPGKRRTRHAQDRLDGFRGHSLRERGMRARRWRGGVAVSRRCSWCTTELATVGAWLGMCRPAWLFSSLGPTAFRIRPRES